MREIYLEKIGNVLKNRRVEKGYSVEDVASILKINPDYIRGLEDYRTELFPAPVFFKGFLKNYATFLELDTNDIMSVYMALTGAVTPESGGEMLQIESAKGTKKVFSLKYIVIAGIIILIIFSWARVSYINYQKKSELEKRMATNFNTMTTAKELALQEEKKKIIAMAQKEDVVKIKTNDNCWVEVRFENSKIFQGLLMAGEEREFSYKKGMVVKVGNAGAVELHVKGDVKKELGRKGEVREFVID